MYANTRQAQKNEQKPYIARSVYCVRFRSSAFVSFPPNELFARDRDKIECGKEEKKRKRLGCVVSARFMCRRNMLKTCDLAYIYYVIEKEIA